jgi:hypothetical protein
MPAKNPEQQPIPAAVPYRRTSNGSVVANASVVVDAFVVDEDDDDDDGDDGDDDVAVVVVEFSFVVFVFHRRSLAGIVGAISSMKIPRALLRVRWDSLADAWAPRLAVAMPLIAMATATSKSTLLLLLWLWLLVVAVDVPDE